MNPAASSPAAPSTIHKFLTLSLAGEGYGIAITSVREIIRYQHVTPVPQLPAHVKGVINLRGRIIPVVDLRTRFGLPPSVCERTCIVVVTLPAGSLRNAFIGLVVDAVEEVAAVADQEIEPTPDFGGTTRTEYLRGVAKIKGTVQMLLDLNRIFAAEDFSGTTTPLPSAA